MYNYIITILDYFGIQIATHFLVGFERMYIAFNLFFISKRYENRFNFALNIFKANWTLFWFF